MKVSIVTVALNAQRTIADSLRSVLAQTYSNFEHIVIDGGSDDGTLDILKSHADPRLRWRSEGDAGLYDAMNKGLHSASGDLIGFLNADDFFCRTDAISLLVQTLQNSPANAVSAAVAIVRQREPERWLRSYASVSFARWMLRFGHMPPHPGFYVRRETFAKIGGFDTSLKIGGDFEWMIRFYHSHNMVAARLPQTIVAVRQGGLSTRGLQSMQVINREALRSCIRHNLRTNPALIWSKYAIKCAQFIAPPYCYPAPKEVRWCP